MKKIIEAKDVAAARCGYAISSTALRKQQMAQFIHRISSFLRVLFIFILFRSIH